MSSLIYSSGPVGRLATSLGWFNFASLPNPITLPFAITIVNNIRGGGTITARLIATSPVNNAIFRPTAAPIWSGAAFGNTAYTLPASSLVCLADNSDTWPNVGTVNVTNIVIRNRFNQLVSNYDLYFLDSETPAANQPQSFTTNGGVWNIFYTLPATAEGNTTLNGIGTTVATTNGGGNMPVLTSVNATSITQTLTGGAALTFGLSFTTIQLSAEVNGRINQLDQFTFSISGIVSGSTTTNTQTTGLQPEGVQVIAGSGLPSYFTFNENMTATSVSTLPFYNPIIILTNLTNVASGGTTVPATLNLGQGVTITSGDYVLATILNTAQPSTLSMSKTVNKATAYVNDTLNYTIGLRNLAPYPLSNVVLIDTIPSGSSFVSNSLKLNGTTISGSPQSPGVSVGTIAIGSVSTVTFSVRVVTTLPSTNIVTNVSNVIYDPDISFTSNILSPSIVTTIPNFINITKFVDKNFATKGEIITYTVSISNSANISATNVVFRDTIPNGTNFISNSFIVNGNSISATNPTTGVTLPDIGPTTVSIASFKVTVS